MTRSRSRAPTAATCPGRASMSSACGTRLATPSRTCSRRRSRRRVRPAQAAEVDHGAGRLSTTSRFPGWRSPWIQTAPSCHSGARSAGSHAAVSAVASSMPRQATRSPRGFLRLARRAARLERSCARRAAVHRRVDLMQRGDEPTEVGRGPRGLARPRWSWRPRLRATGRRTTARGIPRRASPRRRGVRDRERQRSGRVPAAIVLLVDWSSAHGDSRQSHASSSPRRYIALSVPRATVDPHVTTGEGAASIRERRRYDLDRMLRS